MEVAGVLLLFLFVTISEWCWQQRTVRTATLPVPNGPADEPYRVFTDKFDRIVPAEELTHQLWDARPDIYKGWSDRTGEGWRRAEALAGEARLDEGQRDTTAARLFERLADDGTGISPEGLAFCFLLDQSGSMRGAPIAAAAAALDAVTWPLLELGAAVEILGFSTVGWHGGRARQLWIDEGRPQRPGRLCALLHIIYKDASSIDWSGASRRAMHHPDILRENVDGEALRWAAARLRAIPARHHILIVLSDGAPVDDATLLSNGEAYLWRDFERAVGEIEAAGDIRLGAVGIGHSMRVYSDSVESDLAGLTAALVELVDRLTPRTTPPAAPDTAP